MAATPERALDEGRAAARRPAGDRPPPAPAARPPSLLALQRAAGNAAVSALMAGRLRAPGGDTVADIDAALREIRHDDPAVDTVEKGLKAAKAAGVPVDLDGAAQKPPVSALAVTTTGFGPGSVPAKAPVPPPKPVTAKSPLGKAAAKPVHAAAP